MKGKNRILFEKICLTFSKFKIIIDSICTLDFDIFRAVEYSFICSSSLIIFIAVRYYLVG